MAAPADLPVEEPPLEHSGNLKPRRQLEDTEMDITPMIDITFLLLIFFLVASKMDQSTAIELPPAQSGLAVPTKHSVVLTVDVGEGDGPAAVYKGDGAVPDSRFETADLEALEEEIAQYVSDQILEDPRKTYVLIKAAKQLKHREVARVQRAVSKAEGVTQLHVATLEVQ